MKRKRFFLEAAVFVIAAVICATVANAFASRDRKLSLISKVPGAGSRVPRARVTVPGPVTSVPSPGSMVPGPATATSALTTTTSAIPENPSTQTITKSDPGPGTADPGPVESNPAPGTRHPAPKTDPPLKREFLPHPDTAWVEIDPASVRELYGRGAPFIDARRTSVYEEGHIAGSHSIPVWESDLDQRLAAFYELGLDQSAPVVVYCSGGNCEDSHMLSQRLWGLGFNNVYVYKDGYPDWVKNNGKIEKGPAK